MPMRQSRMSDAWIAEALRNNPISINPKTGNIVTCPVRLSWINVFHPAVPMAGDEANDKKVPIFSAQLWFPPGSIDMINTIMVPRWQQEVAKHFPNHNPATLHQPLRDQAFQEKYGGTPGLPFITASTQWKPQVCDTSFNPIVEESRLYPGVWAICSLNLYPFGLRPVRPKKGVSFGLVQIMIVQDDENLAGSAPPPQEDFAGVKIAQSFNPAGAFGSAPAGVPLGAAPSSILPPAQGVGGFAPQSAGGFTPPSYAPPAQATGAFTSTAGSFAPGYAPPPLTHAQHIGVHPPAPTNQLPALPPGIRMEDVL